MKIEIPCALDSGEHVRVLVLDCAADAAISGIGQRIGKVRWCSPGTTLPFGRFEAGISLIGGVSEHPGPRRCAD